MCPGANKISSDRFADAITDEGIRRLSMSVIASHIARLGEGRGWQRNIESFELVGR